MSDFLSALRISGSALSAQRTRVNLASSNLANAESTRGPDGQPYHGATRCSPRCLSRPTGRRGQRRQPGAQGVAVSQVLEDLPRQAGLPARPPRR